MEQKPPPELIKVLTACRSAIASLSPEALGQHPEIGYFYRDELLSNIDDAVAAPLVATNASKCGQYTFEENRDECCDVAILSDGVAIAHATCVAVASHICDALNATIPSPTAAREAAEEIKIKYLDVTPNDELINDLTAIISRYYSPPADVEAMRNALRDIASQQLTSEKERIDGEIQGDFEYAYDKMIEVARASLPTEEK